MVIKLKERPQCGGKGKIRYKKPYHWVECKKCDYMTDIFCDYYEENDYESKKAACDFWNNGGII